MPSAYALGIVSRNSILDFGVAERLRALRYPFFTAGVVKGNGSRTACIPSFLVLFLSFRLKRCMKRAG